MNITKMKVDDFGAWHDLVLADLKDRATVFYGPNEAGKTTLLNFIRTVFYGFSESRCQRYLPPAQGDSAGGSLDVADVSGRFCVHRSAPARYQGGSGTLRLSSPDGGHQGNELLTTILSGVDETIFNNVFAVGLTQMQQLSTLSDTEAASQLYGLAAGVDRVSLFEVTQALEKKRSALLSDKTSTDAASGRIDDLLQQRERLHMEMKALRRDADHWANLRKEHLEVTAKIKQQEVMQKRLNGQGDWTQLSETVRKQWSRCCELNARLGRLGPLPDIPDHVAPRVTDLSTKIKLRRGEWEKLRDERKRVKAKAAALRGGDTLYRHGAEIEALDRQRNRIVELEIDVSQCKAQVDELEFELQAELEGLGLQTGTSGRQLPQISDRVIEALRIPAREIRELRARLDAAKYAAENTRKEAKELRMQLETASLRHGSEDVNTALNRGQTLVGQLERRLQLDQHREDIVRRLDDMHQENKYWLRRGVLPWRGIMVACGVFSGGVMLLLTGLLIDWFPLPATNGWAMMLIGGTLSMISLVIKNSFEHNALERASTVGRQIEVLVEEQASAGEESAELDRTLPPGSGNLDQRLIDTRAELVELEKFVPLRNRLQEIDHETQAAEHQATFAVHQLKDARRAWKASLRSVGLPDSLTPAQVGQMTGKVSDITRLRNRISEAKQVFLERQQELETIRGRIVQLQSLAGFTTVTEGLGQQLNRLKAELEKHARSGRELDQLRARWDELAQQQTRTSDDAHRMMADRRRLLVGHGVSSTREFRDVQARVNKARSMRKQRDENLGEIAEVLGDEFTVKQLQKQLDQNSASVTDRIDALDRDHSEVGSELGKLHERNGELKQRLDGHLQDRRHDRKELQLRVLDEQIKAATREWLRSALASAALEKVRQTYETKRQPVALAEASRYLERLSEGRYTRIWTPMGRNALCVDSAHGDSLSVEKLSRGTREQLFLSLRLALVSSYKRRGASMPLVLDDIFVNFDDQRAGAAAKVLFDVAETGQQMLIFTCHQRMRDIFAELGGDVRDLPLRDRSKIPVSPQLKPQEPPRIAPEHAKSLDQPTAPVQAAAIPVDADLPVYDADSWKETVDLLAVSTIPTKQASSGGHHLAKPALASGDLEDEYLWEGDLEMADVEPSRPRLKFEPAWRDECLEPLPDLDDAI